LQPGVTNLGVTDVVAADGFFYAPDPSSQLACTIAGNIGMNSGGAHCLKYGVTSNNLMGVEMVLPTGEVVRLGGKHLDSGGLDLLGLITGSEGMLGLVTEATLRILHSPEGARPILFGFAESAQAGACVDAIISSGIIPVAIEFMDRPAIHATEKFAKAGYPLDVEALLIVEVEGSNDEIDSLLGRIQAIAADFNPAYERIAKTSAESLAIWKGRKSAFGAIGQISPDYFCMDGTIPTGKLPEALERIGAICDSYGFQVANIFHAGDGNLHPLVLYNANAPGETERAEECGGDILKLCVELGGCLTGEHGVGVEKRDLMTEQFSPEELDLQRRMKRVFDPKYLMNPHKVFPLVDPPVLEAAE
jgi:glycolate oxidase